MIVGSLIKNPGGGLAPIGGCICGYARRAETAVLIARPRRVWGQEVGANRGLMPLVLSGLSLSPTVVPGALKGAVFAAACYSWASVVPGSTESPRHHSGRRARLARGDGRLLQVGIQSAAPVDSYCYASSRGRCRP